MDALYPGVCSLYCHFAQPQDQRPWIFPRGLLHAGAAGQWVHYAAVERFGEYFGFAGGLPGFPAVYL